jgi:TetR/AcrR family transcriptional regulator, transcriptional repressor for nem operon
MPDRTKPRAKERAGRDAASPAKPARTRAPEATRERLLAAAFAEIHRRGYQAASLDAILASAGVTKGALYHHFTDKADLGRAVIDEVVVALTVGRWTAPLARHDGDPIEGIKGALRAVSAEFTTEEFADRVELGCPLNNLTQEMSPLDESFRRQLLDAFAIWTDAFAGALERGQAAGIVRKDVAPREVATFLIASVEGSFGLAKNARRAEIVRSNLEILCGYLDGLREGQRPQ